LFLLLHVYLSVNTIFDILIKFPAKSLYRENQKR
jgi:hypothetical protein